MASRPHIFEEELSERIQSQDQSIVICNSAEALSAITHRDIELVIWRRAVPTGFRRWIEGMDPAYWPDLRIASQYQNLKRTLQPHLDSSGMPADDMRDFLIEDIERLASIYSSVTGEDLVDVRLERVQDDACSKFHRDCVQARLLTTYCGPATEWVQPAHAQQALNEQKQYRGPLEHLEPFDVAIFKGSCAGPGSGIVHRSPPISGTGHTRLLLCLNKLSGISPKPCPSVVKY